MNDLGIDNIAILIFFIESNDIEITSRTTPVIDGHAAVAIAHVNADIAIILIETQVRIVLIDQRIRGQGIRRAVMIGIQQTINVMIRLIVLAYEYDLGRIIPPFDSDGQARTSCIAIAIFYSVSKWHGLLITNIQGICSRFVHSECVLTTLINGQVTIRGVDGYS